MHEGLPTPVSPSLDAFLKRMGAAFGAPDTAYAGEFKRLLNDRVGFQPEGILLEAADWFIENRKSWPKIADVIAAVKNAEAASKIKDRPAKSVERDPWSWEAQKYADDLMNSDLGRRAAQEGWIGSLWDFCRKFGRLPHEGIETKRIVESAYRLLQLRQKVKRGEVELSKELAAPLRKLALAFDEHDAKLTALANPAAYMEQNKMEDRNV